MAACAPLNCAGHRLLGMLSGLPASRASFGQSAAWEHGIRHKAASPPCEPTRMRRLFAWHEASAVV